MTPAILPPMIAPMFFEPEDDAEAFEFGDGAIDPSVDSAVIEAGNSTVYVTVAPEETTV